MPEDLLKRADEILAQYENNSKKNNFKEEKVQLSFDFSEPKKESDDLKKKLENIDPLNMTPIEALNFLYELKKNAK